MKKWVMLAIAPIILVSCKEKEETFDEIRNIVISAENGTPVFSVMGRCNGWHWDSYNYIVRCNTGKNLVVHQISKPSKSTVVNSFLDFATNGEYPYELNNGSTK